MFRIISQRLIQAILVCVISAVAFWGCEPSSTEWHTETDYRWKNMGPSFHLFEDNGFEKKSSEITGINFENSLSDEQIKENRNLLNGSGVAVGDIDGDGHIDIYFAKLNGPNKLFKNLGDWQFKNITREAGLALEGQFSTGVNFVDIDGDGDLDLHVTALGSTNKLFINDGTGRFEEDPEALGTDIHGSMSSSFADIDRDGDLDLYITNYKKKSAKDLYPNQRGFSDILKQNEQGDYYIPKHLKPHYEYEWKGDVLLWFEKGENDLIYKNDGNGNFNRIPFSSGIFRDENGHPVTDHQGWGLHSRFFDIDEDGYPDLYVCNDFETKDRIWMNNQDGTFTELSTKAIRHLSLSSMSVDISDINRDSEYDIFVVEMMSRDYQLRSKQLSTMIPLPDTTGNIYNQPLYMGNSLYLKRKDNTFAEIAHYSGVTASEWSWAISFLDVDLDGFEDIIVATGNYFDTQDLDANTKIARKENMGIINPREVMFEYPTLESQNVAFHNKGNLKFEDRSSEWGFGSKDISHGMAAADLDNDGDQDLIFNRLESEAGVYENNSTKPRIRVKLQGNTPNTDAIGSTVKVSTGSLTQKKQVTGSGPYLSGSSYDYTFAASHDSAMRIKVTWTDQTVTEISNVKPNRFYEIQKPDDQSNTDVSAADETETPFFEDASSKINHEHTDLFYDDFEVQPLLPKRLSQYGPGASIFDVNSDGADDILIGTGRGGRLAYYENDGNGNFTGYMDQNLNFIAKNDQSGIIGWKDSYGTHLAVGNYFYENRNSFSNAFFKFTKDQSGFIRDSTVLSSSNQKAATGPLAMVDIDADGDLDLFAGMRFEPARYPAPVSSHLFINEDGTLTEAEDTKALFKNIGMISGATFSDLNTDGYPDLLLATSWGSIRIFKNDKGTFTDATESSVFANLSGSWNGITTGDFNNDGRLDIVATNQGLNDFYASDDKETKYLFYGNLNEDSNIDIIEGDFDNSFDAFVPTRKLRLLGSEIPLIGKRFYSHDQFSRSTLQEIVGEASSNLDTLKLNQPKTMLFLNTGDGLTPSPLPIESQLAPAFSAIVADFNGDGNEDIFLSQNFFGNRTQDRRMDSGRGLWLKGDGTGNFTAVQGTRSGIKVYGEQRAAAVSDINRDGRIDLLVTQNGGPTKLFVNKQAKQGLTITLKGTKDNPDAIGASVRLKYEDGFGPRREIKAGSGYWSQNGSDILLGYRNYPEAVEVHWPGGKSDTVNLTQKSDNIVIYYDGSIDYK